MHHMYQDVLVYISAEAFTFLWRHCSHEKALFFFAFTSDDPVVGAIFKARLYVDKMLEGFWRCLWVGYLRTVCPVRWSCW